jgi:hypothetical protein
VKSETHRLVWPIGFKLAIDAIRWASAAVLAIGVRTTLPRLIPCRPLAFHEPLDRAASYIVTFTVQLSPDFVSAVDLHIGLPNPFNFRIQHVLTFGASAMQCSIPLLGSITR